MVDGWWSYTTILNRKILLGGAKLSSNLIEQALANQLPIYNSFGMTETCSQFLTASPEMLAQKHDTVGKPSDNVKVKLRILIKMVTVNFLSKVKM